MDFKWQIKAGLSNQEPNFDIRLCNYVEAKMMFAVGREIIREFRNS
jgi:hypothetical protein